LASLTVAVTANTAALTTSSAASVAKGGLGAASAAGSAGGFFSGIGSLFSLFARGGIVPAASGGWALPSSFGSDRVMAALTPGEMVLPRHLSAGFQRMLGGGGAGGAEGGGDVHLHIHGNIVDAPGIERFFRDNRRHITAVVQSALRDGALNPLG
ncbi:MAG TPA: hypothetical protein VNF04_05495, partial [Stellaceae bacterium]|nr:hypothetical protein [Stellaceae bacterium]